MTSRVHERNDKHSSGKAFKRPLPRLELLLHSMICIPVGSWIGAEQREYVVDRTRAGW
jgi:hypothetical protein